MPASTALGTTYAAAPAPRQSIRTTDRKPTRGLTRGSTASALRGADGATARPPAPSTGTPAASAVLQAVRRAGPTFRDELVDATGLSTATVNRQVAALLAAGLVRERADLAPPGAVGRPRIPIEVDPDGFGVLGLHLGVRRATLAVGDLRGRVIGAVDVPNPDGDASEVITMLSRRLRGFGARWPERRMLQVGLVVGGQLSADRTRFRHSRLGWDTAPLAEIVDRVTDSDVVVVPQVEAMAGAHTLLARRRTTGSTLYVYAREAVGAVLTGADGEATTTPGTISHLPVGGSARCSCGSAGCLEASAGDGAVVAAAQTAGLVSEPSISAVVSAAREGGRAAHELLVDRARLLGRGVALVRDVLNPDRVVLLGQAFTRYRPGLAHVSAAFASATALEPLSLQVSALGPGVQAIAACTAALRPVYADPLGSVLRGRSRRP